jgi:hypothetical protein
VRAFGCVEEIMSVSQCDRSLKEVLIYLHMQVKLTYCLFLLKYFALVKGSFLLRLDTPTIEI